MAGKTSYYHCDASGNVRALTDSNQNVTDRYAYDAFGNTVAQSGTTENNFRFGGQVGYHLNPDSGSYYVRQREYQPTIIRWMSVDPLGFRAGDNNLYRYVANRPVMSSDPTGTDAEAYSCEVVEGLIGFLKSAGTAPLSPQCLLCAQCIALYSELGPAGIAAMCSRMCVPCTISIGDRLGRCRWPRSVAICFRPVAKKVKCRFSIGRLTARQVSLTTFPQDAPAIGGQPCEIGGPLAMFVGTWTCDDGTSYNICTQELTDLKKLSVDKNVVFKKFSSKGQFERFICTGKEKPWNGVCPEGLLRDS